MRADTTTTKAEGFTTNVPIIIWSLTIEDTIFSSSNMDIKIFVALSLIISLAHGYLNPFYDYLDSNPFAQGHIEMLSPAQRYEITFFYYLKKCLILK